MKSSCIIFKWNERHRAYRVDAKSFWSGDHKTVFLLKLSQNWLNFRLNALLNQSLKLLDLQSYGFIFQMNVLYCLRGQ